MKQTLNKTATLAAIATILAGGFVIPTFASTVENQSTSNSLTSQIQSKNIRISEVKVASSVEPGQAFPITFRIENLSEGTIYGLSLKVTNVEGKATLDPFMPVGTTNEIYVGRIGYQDVREVTLTLQSSPMIQDGVYNFNTSVMFNVNDQAEEEITKTIGVMVQNTRNVSLTGIQVIDGAMNATLMNEGTVKIRQAKATLTVGEQVVEQTIGNVDSDSEGYISLPLPTVTTDTPAKLAVTYVDSTGSQRTVEGTTTVSAMPEESVQLEETQPQSFWDKVKSFFGFGDK
ncbi:MAG: hypothetical protein ACRC3A_08050 [Culicoidibacterales bacterium]